jgi:RND superfamily putative drug exporter
VNSDKGRSKANAEPEQIALLGRAANAATRRPRVIIGVWLVVMAALAVFGLGIGSKLSTTPLYVDGSATKRAHEIAVREFGNEEAFIVMLRGPRASVDRQGHQLLRRVGSVPGTLVISPWSSGRTIAGLRPAPGVAALLVEVTPRSGEGTLGVVASVQHEVHTTVRPPVQASIAGGPVIIDSFHRAAEDAAAMGERIAIPILLVVLLIVFRSVLAAAIPVIVGGAVVAATRGVMDLSLGFIHIESFALGPAGMMGLALGVDYTLLVVSRFREQMEGSDNVAQAVHTTVRTTGRAVIPAGCGLIFAMLIGSFVLPSPLLVSAAFAVIVVAILSMASAILVTPAALMLLGRNLDRWALAVPPSGQSVFSRWSESLSRRPLVLAPIMMVLLSLAVWAFTLRSEAATISLLPGDDAGRVQQEEIEETMGPGWAAPMEIVMDGGSRPVTTPERLRALARFQYRVEADSDVIAMAGLAPIERSTGALGAADRSLAGQSKGLTRLGRGIANARAGSGAAVGRLANATEGAGQLNSAIGVAARGSGQLAGGLDAADSGSSRLAGGLDRASTGSEQLTGGISEASAGSGQLASGLARAQKQGGQLTGSSRLLENAIRSGDQGLAGLHSPLRASEEELAVALRTLQGMSGGQADPGYATALRAVESASEHLTGNAPSTGERIDPSYEGVGAGIEHGQNQFSLSMYLARKIDKSGKKATHGLSKLQRSSSQLAQGLGRLTAGSRQLSNEIARLGRGGKAISPGLQKLAEGAKHLTAGLNEANAGADGLAGGLSGGNRAFRNLTDALGGIEAGVKRQQGSSQLGRLEDRSPGLFRSGYFYLASLDGSRSSQRRQAAFLIDLDHGGHAARMLVIPRYGSVSSQTDALRDRLEKNAAGLARETGSTVVVGGVPATQADLNGFYRDQAPLLRLALLLVSVVVLIAVLRSLTIPIVAALLNLVTVAASFGVLALLFNGSVIGGPGYVDSTVIPATIMVMFGLSIDYEVFIFARMREEYVRTGSPQAAVKNGIDHTAHVITGAAIIMIAVFVAFSLSPFVTIRNFGVAQAVAVFIDAFIIRLIILPALMRTMGKWSWWWPRPFAR